jgi:type I restriction enzyme M protein
MTHFQNRQSAVAVTKRSTVVNHPTNEQLKQLEADLWSAANNLRANSDLKSSEYATPVLGLIFLKFADDNYRRHEADIIAEYQKLKGTRRERKLSDIAIEKCGFYLPDHARYGLSAGSP